MTSLEWVSGDILAESVQARVALAGAPTVVWTVTDVEEVRSFTWETHMRGVHTVAGL